MKKNFQKSLIWFICAVFVCLSGAQTVRAAEISEQSDLAQQLAYQAALTMYYDDRYSIQNDYPDQWTDCDVTSGTEWSGQLCQGQ